MLINIGRGNVITESQLILALDSGWMSYAILDVFETEPLHKDSKLWAHDKVCI